MKLDEWKAALAAPTLAPGETAAKSFAPAGKPQAPVGKTSLGGEDRRRSQRVLLRVRINVHLALQGKPATLAAVTLSVSDRGALIALNQSLPIESRLVIEHAGTMERVACRVARQPLEVPEGFHIGIEFDSPAPDFWRIAFPPANWRAEGL